MRKLLQLIIVVLLTNVGIRISVAQEGDTQLWEEWKLCKKWAYNKDVENLDSAMVAETGSRIRKWLEEKVETSSRQGEAERYQEILKTELIDFTKALAYARDGNYSRARDALASEAASQHSMQRNLLENTRSPAVFAQNVFLLHSKILANSNIKEPIPHLGYHVFDVSTDKRRRFVFGYGSDQEFQDEFKTEGVKTTEQKKLFFLIDEQSDGSGEFGIIGKAQVIADRSLFTAEMVEENGGFFLVLNGVNKVVEYVGEFGGFIVRPSSQKSVKLQILEDGIEQPYNSNAKHSERAPSTNEWEMEALAPAQEKPSFGIYFIAALVGVVLALVLLKLRK
jgi:hypothetical protein